MEKVVAGIDIGARIYGRPDGGYVKILPSSLAQDNATVLGAAGLLWKEITD